MTSEKESYVINIKSCALPIKPPPRGIDLPCDDGEPMETGRHRQQMALLIALLTEAWRDRKDFFVGGNMFVYYSDLQAKHNDFRGPDFFVVTHTEWNPSRRSWVVWEEDGRTPELVVELLSQSTEAEDRGRKKDIYARLLRVKEYFLYDPWDQRLEGYRLNLSTDSYEPMAKNEEGRYWSHVLGHFLGVAPGSYERVEIDWLRLFDAEGRLVPLPEERAEEAALLAKEAEQRASEAEQRAMAEAQRASDALARLAELERLVQSAKRTENR